MASSRLQEFIQMVSEDEHLQEQLKTIINERCPETTEALAQICVDMARDHDFELSLAELHTFVKNMAADPEGIELTDEELASVAGGQQGVLIGRGRMGTPLDVLNRYGGP